MDTFEIQCIETIVIILVYLALRFTINKIVDRTVERSMMNKARGKIIKKAIYLTILTICLTTVLVIWGIEQSEIVVFIGSVLAVIGIALFAQWSILSNITSGILIFFNHSVKLEDTITIIDKDYAVEGRVSDIGLFFVILKTKEGEHISVPNNVFIQKMIKKKLASASEGK